MAEGHTLHRLARSQTARFAGFPVSVSSPQGRSADGAALVDGHVLHAVHAHGKHLFAEFGDRTVHVHLGLFGEYRGGEGNPPDPVGAVRMRWVGGAQREHWTELRGAPVCELLSPSEVAAIEQHLGPDPLAARPDGTDAWARVSRSRAPIAGLLMDQAVVAGIGNAYRAEILFRHGIDPMCPGRLVDVGRWDALWADLVVLMRAGLRTGRIVTTEPVDRRRRSGRVGADDAHYVYRRAGLPCRRCGTPVAMALYQGRKLYWCPTCQAP